MRSSRRRIGVGVFLVVGSAAWFRKRRTTAVSGPPVAVPWPPLPPDPEAADRASTAPAAADAAEQPSWVEGCDGSGNCPDSHPVKVKLRSGLFHLPGMALYDRTKADRCYATADEATADGFRPSSR